MPARTMYVRSSGMNGGLILDLDYKSTGKVYYSRKLNRIAKGYFLPVLLA